MLTLDEVDRRSEYLQKFEPRQAHVRRQFKLPKSDPDALRRVAAIYNPPPWAQGCISIHDAAFLYDLVRGIRPRRAIEVGVASGGSTVLLLSALQDAGLAEQHALHSFDLHPFCYFDRSKPVGCLVNEQVPELTSAWKFHVRATARDAGSLFAHEPVTFAFIDADHRHPATTADLLSLAPALAPGAWVALHDIDLPTVALAHERRTGERAAWSHRGPKELFEGWPWAKVRGGTLGTETGGTNIGAIQMPASLTAKDLSHIVDKPWEMQPTDDMLSVLRA
jgi:predicted O-methyltransferase YrrM